MAGPPFVRCSPAQGWVADESAENGQIGQDSRRPARTPFLRLTVDRQGERGLVGLAFDPDFAENGFVYVVYTATTPRSHQRVSRFTANGDVALPAEQIIWDFDPLVDTIHVSGAIGFGPDGKLYVAHGDNNRRGMAQGLDNQLGKIIRLNPDGTIPTDNPFVGTAIGDNRAI